MSIGLSYTETMKTSNLCFASAGFVVSAIIGLATKFAYNSLFFYILLNMPRSFTFGEASIVSQGVIIFSFNVLLKIAAIPHYNPLTNMEKMSMILQVIAR